MILNAIAFVLLSLSASAEASSFSQRELGILKFPASPRVVHQFPNPTWLENIAVRSNGDILATQTVYTPTLYQISNPESASPETSILHNFTTGPLLGITEVKHDVFLFVEVEYTEIAVPVPKTAKVWKIDFNTKKGQPRISNIANTTEISFPNGITTLPGTESILITDSLKGLIWRFDLDTRKASVVLDYPELKPAQNSKLNYTIGVNGVHIFQNYAYWTDSLVATIYRIKIDLKTGEALPGASVEKIASADKDFLDDFIIDSQGGLYSASSDGTVIYAPRGADKMTVVAGSPGSLTYSGPTAFAFGRDHEGKQNDSVMYITTNGGLVSPINGTMTEGGKIIAVYA